MVLGGREGFSVRPAARSLHLPLSPTALPELREGRSGPAGPEPLPGGGSHVHLSCALELGWLGGIPMAMALILGLGPWRAQAALGARGLSPTGVGRGAVREGQGLTPACLGGPTVLLSRPGGVERGLGQGWGAGASGSRLSSVPKHRSPHAPLPPLCPGPGVRRCQAAAAAAAGGAGEAGAATWGAGRDPGPADAGARPLAGAV